MEEINVFLFIQVTFFVVFFYNISPTLPSLDYTVELKLIQIKSKTLRNKAQFQFLTDYGWKWVNWDVHSQFIQNNLVLKQIEA